MGSNFPEELVPGMINKVRGKSSLATLSTQMPIAFTGNKLFTFSFDKDVAIVGENAAKPVGDATLGAVTVSPVKVVYQMRASDEFMTASDEYQLGILRAFGDGWARKLARGIDIMAFHRANPATGTVSTLLQTTACFDTAVTTNVVIAGSGSGQVSGADAQVEAAIAQVEAGEHEVTGMAMAPAFRSSLAAITLQSGEAKFPELAWGNAPSVINGLEVSVNPTVSTLGNSTASLDLAIVGNFEDYFRWGYAKEMPIEVIEYGDPDGQGDLKKLNQVLIRGEAYVGFSVLDPSAFSIIKSAS